MHLLGKVGRSMRRVGRGTGSHHVFQANAQCARLATFHQLVPCWVHYVAKDYVGLNQTGCKDNSKDVSSGRARRFDLIVCVDE